MLCAAAVTGQFVGGKATRDALFLTTLGFQALPTMLIAASVCSILLVGAHARWAAKTAPSSLIQILFAASGVLFLCEWVARFTAPAATAVLLFVHTSAMGPLLASGFWLIATERFDPRTAKRRFGQITGAGTLGGLLGALVSERVAVTLGAPAMLLVLAAIPVPDGLAVFAVCCLRAIVCRERTPRRLGSARSGPRPRARSLLRVIAEAPHLQHLVVLVLLGSTGAALLDYLFKAKAVEAVGTGDQLLRFFALYYAAISLVTFILQVVSSRVALERFGLALTASTPSIALLAGSVGGLVTPGFSSLMAARAGESVFRGSWFRAGYELFYTPIPAAEKRAVKSVVDVGVDRLGDAVGGGLIRLAALLAPAVQSSAILWMAMASSIVAILAASRLNHWYVRTLGTSLVIAGAGPRSIATPKGSLTRSMLLRIRERANRANLRESPERDEDARALLRSGNRERAIEVLSREEGLTAGLVPHAIPLLAGPLSDYALFALRKVAEERVGQLTDALLDPNQDYAVRRQLARVFSICVSQRAADALLLALDDHRFDVRFQCARSLAAIVGEKPAHPRRSRSRAGGRSPRSRGGRPVWESRRLLDGAVNESPLDEFVRDRAGQSLAHVFTLLSLVLPSQPLQIAFRSLHSENAPPSRYGARVSRRRAARRDPGALWPFLVNAWRQALLPASPRSDGQSAAIQFVRHAASIRWSPAVEVR